MGKPGKYFRIFFRDPDTRDRAWDFYVHWKSIYSLGESEIGFLRQLMGFQSVAVYYLMAEKLSERLGIVIPLSLLYWLVPVMLFSRVALYLAFGIYWDRKRMPSRMMKWSNDRNDLLRAIGEATHGGK